MDAKVPVLAVGTYHRKEAAPILAAAARLDLTAATASATTSKDKNKSNKGEFYMFGKYSESF